MSAPDRTERRSGVIGRHQQRHAVKVQAIVTGLAPSILPLVIREVSRRGMYIAFGTHAAAVDEEWAKIGANLKISFKATVDGYRQRITVYGQIKRIEPEGIGVRLVTSEETTLAALRSLVVDAIATRSAAPRAAHKPVTPPADEALVQALPECEGLLQRHFPTILDAYLQGILNVLSRSKCGAPSFGEKQTIQTVIYLLEKNRHRIEQVTHLGLIAAFETYYRGQAQSVRETSFNGAANLALLESSDQRASLAMIAAADLVSKRVGLRWHKVTQRLADVSRPSAGTSPIGPTAMCYRVRDLLYQDASLGVLREIDPTTGFGDEFVHALGALYRDMNSAFERRGLGATR